MALNGFDEMLHHRPLGDATERMAGGVLDNWIWGLSLIALTMTVHAMGVAAMAFAVVDLRDRLVSESPGLRHAFLVLSGLIGSIGLLLAALHAVEAWMWAAAYLWVGALGGSVDALVYSVDSMTTRGGAGVAVDSHWRVMGVLEAVDGMLLFGISTAFAFTVMQIYWPILAGSRRH